MKIREDSSFALKARRFENIMKLSFVLCLLNQEITYMCVIFYYVLTVCAIMLDVLRAVWVNFTIMLDVLRAVKIKIYLFEDVLRAVKIKIYLFEDVLRAVWLRNYILFDLLWRDLICDVRRGLFVLIMKEMCDIANVT